MSEIIDLTTQAGFSIDGISSPCSAYSQYIYDSKLEYTLMKGTKEMREAGKLYLPQEEAESENAYKNRLKRTFLYNLYKRTVKKLAGTVFSKPIIINTEDPDIRNLMFNFDFQGNNINVVGFRHFADAISYGVSHILVDYPDINLLDKNGQMFIEKDGKFELLSLKQEKELNLRPFATVIPATNIIGWKYETVNGVRKLVNVRIKDTVTFPDGRFGEVKKERIRVLTPGFYEVYIKEKDWELVSGGKTGIDYIPLFSFFTGEDINGLICDLPLEDLAYLNLEHWQSSSDQRNVLHYARLITFLGIELDDAMEDKKIVIGCNQIVHSSSPTGDLKVVEHSGKAIEAGANDLRQIEKQMQEFGYNITNNKVSRETATSRVIDSVEANSTLKNWALNYNDLMNTVIDCMADYLGKEKASISTNSTEDIPDYVKVNTDINPSFGGVGADILTTALKENSIDIENYLIELKRRGIIREGANIKHILEKVKKQEIKNANITN